MEIHNIDSVQLSQTSMDVSITDLMLHIDETDLQLPEYNMRSLLQT